jgi:hypothetical protein
MPRTCRALHLRTRRGCEDPKAKQIMGGAEWSLGAAIAGGRAVLRCDVCDPPSASSLVALWKYGSSSVIVGKVC